MFSGTIGRTLQPDRRRYDAGEAKTLITEFTPYAALLGGAFIGLASVLLMLTLGRIMGATGIVEGIMFAKSKDDFQWRIALLLGMFMGPFVFQAVSGAAPVIQIPVTRPLLILGGILVGIGVTFGSGCTSGHGVCGIARLSPRSIAATLTFMATTAITVYVMRHVIGA
jgi:uncharacterized membrane protein YedE/YeeE